MASPEFLTAGAIAGFIAVTLVFTAIKIVRQAAPSVPHRQPKARPAKPFWPPLAPGRR